MTPEEKELLNYAQRVFMEAVTAIGKKALRTDVTPPGLAAVMEVITRSLYEAAKVSGDLMLGLGKDDYDAMPKFDDKDDTTPTKRSPYNHT